MGWLPPLRGVIDRRILLNYRIEPGALGDVLPAGFEPRTVDGVAIGGVCCLRLEAVRPQGLPAFLGVRSENAAHRIGATWNDGEGPVDGVYVPCRHTNSRLTARLGGRSFGRHERAAFDVAETAERYEITIRTRAGEERLALAATVANALPDASVFDSVDAAVAYHRRGTIGYSPAPDGDRYDGLELLVDEWEVTPLAVERARASYFAERLPAEAIELDGALLMTGVGTDLRRVGSRAAGACPGPSAGGRGETATDERTAPQRSSKGSSGS